MGTKKNTLATTVQQKRYIDGVEERVRDLEHALNLLVIGAVNWFACCTDSDGTTHQFGFGVAMNQPIEKNLRNLFRLALGDSENRIIVFWHSLDDAGHQHITAHSRDDFESIPFELETAQGTDSNVQLIHVVREALMKLSEAVQSAPRVAV